MKMIKLAQVLSICVFFGLFSGAIGIAAKPKEVKLVLWEHEYEDIQKILDEQISEFEKANPGVSIKRAHYKTEDLRTQYQTAALGGGGPELVIAPNDFAGPLSVMGIIRPVNDLIEKDLFFPGVISAVSDSKGKIWGIPLSQGNHLMLFVNKKYVKKAPATIEEMIKVAKLAQKNPGVYGLAYNLNEPFWFVTFMGAYGEKPLVKDEPNLGSAGTIEALELVHRLKFKEKIVPGDCDYTCADTLFAEGKAAMTINGDWAVPKYSEILKSNLIIAPLPKLASTGKYMTPMISGKYLFFNSKIKGDKLEAAKKFAEFLTKKESQVYAAQKGGRLPALKEAAVSDVITKNPELMASQDALEHGQPMPMDVALRAVWDAIRPQLQNVMAGKTEAKPAAIAMQKDAQTKIKEMRQ